MKALITLMPLLIMQSTDKVTKPESDKQPFALKIDQETYLTDTQGVANPNTIIKMIPGNVVRIYLTDGTFFTATVKETTMHSEGIFKAFGEISNPPNMGFGFVLTKDGVFAGAIVNRTTNVTYKLKYSEAHQGHVFLMDITASGNLIQ